MVYDSFRRAVSRGWRCIIATGVCICPFFTTRLIFKLFWSRSGTSIFSPSLCFWTAKTGSRRAGKTLTVSYSETGLCHNICILPKDVKVQIQPARLTKIYICVIQLVKKGQNMQEVEKVDFLLVKDTRGRCVIYGVFRTNHKNLYKKKKRSKIFFLSERYILAGWQVLTKSSLCKVCYTLYIHETNILKGIVKWEIFFS